MASRCLDDFMPINMHKGYTNRNTGHAFFMTIGRLSNNNTDHASFQASDTLSGHTSLLEHASFTIINWLRGHTSSVGRMKLQNWKIIIIINALLLF